MTSLMNMTNLPGSNRRKTLYTYDYESDKLGSKLLQNKEISTLMSEFLKGKKTSESQNCKNASNNNNNQLNEDPYVPVYVMEEERRAKNNQEVMMQDIAEFEKKQKEDEEKKKEEERKKKEEQMMMLNSVAESGPETDTIFSPKTGKSVRTASVISAPPRKRKRKEDEADQNHEFFELTPEKLAKINEMKMKNKKLNFKKEEENAASSNPTTTTTT
eukprot:TRINITY_DN2610_c0_g1_i1.p1 TRINITY_DN2610_c0_g1~~TRINITY_DN2610_c0_g1_i1.p1  ORF type:complete len:216 (-),score=56.47 TRINITY_DN2610_c0_g1_i1:653-1300(-)